MPGTEFKTYKNYMLYFYSHFTDEETEVHKFSAQVQSLSCVWLCDPMNCSMPASSVLPYLPDFAQTHVHWVSDAIQPFQPLLPPSPPALSISQHQGLFQWVGSLHQVAEVLELPLQHQFFPVAVHGWFSWLVWSSSCPRKSQVVSKYQSFGAQPSLWSNSHISTWLLEKP